VRYKVTRGARGTRRLVMTVGTGGRSNNFIYYNYDNIQ
jgi:hypothetical protein